MEYLNTWEEIEKRLLQHNLMKEAILDTAKDIVEQLKDIIENEMYSKAPSKHYNPRTRDFINSLSVKIMPSNNSREYGVKIFFDTSKIRAWEYDNSKGNYQLNRHMSVDKEDVSKYIPEWMDTGNNPNGKNPIISYEGYGFTKEIERILNNSNFVKNKIKIKLAKNGYIVDF